MNPLHSPEALAAFPHLRYEVRDIAVEQMLSRKVQVLMDALVERRDVSAEYADLSTATSGVCAELDLTDDADLADRDIRNSFSRQVDAVKHATSVLEHVEKIVEQRRLEEEFASTLAAIRSLPVVTTERDTRPRQREQRSTRQASTSTAESPPGRSTDDPRPRRAARYADPASGEATCRCGQRKWDKPDTDRDTATCLICGDHPRTPAARALAEAVRWDADRPNWSGSEFVGIAEFDARLSTPVSTDPVADGRACDVCGKPLRSRRDDARFCSPSCKKRAKRSRQKGAES